ncbi:hypothetical protein [Coleofasciculus sp. H7-2]|uniref:hypothetical protein n=1 Tax=Coleofasciculus sp. H7-2 TaxID=3351545 RepID=UPI00366C3DF7
MTSRRVGEFLGQVSLEECLPLAKLLSFQQGYYCTRSASTFGESASDSRASIAILSGAAALVQVFL